MSPASASSLPVRSLLHRPRQKRSIARVHAILDGAIEVLILDGLEGFNTNRVAECAGVPVGSLYQYFPHKEAILAAVLERGVLEARALMWKVLEQGLDRPLEETVSSGVDALVDMLLPHRALTGALMEGVPLLGPSAGMQPLEDTLRELATAWVRARPGRHQPDLAQLFLLVRGGVFSFLAWVVEQPEELPRDVFVPALTGHIVDTMTPR